MTLSLVNACLSNTKLGAVEKLVLIGYCNEANHLVQACPDIESLQQISGVKRQAVLRAVKALLKNNLLEATGDYCPRTSRAIYQIKLG